MIRKILLTAAACAFMSTPAWALPSQANSNHGNAPSDTPNNNSNPGEGHGNGKGGGQNHGQGQGHHGKSHKCMAHKVGYVASGTLSSQTLTKNEDGTYSGEITVEVTQTNHHAMADKGKTVTYKVSGVHVTLGVSDANNDGSVGIDDAVKGDEVHVIGKVTALAKKCDQSSFTAETTIRKLVITAPSSAGTSSS
jgi:hypothetical protein